MATSSCCRFMGHGAHDCPGKASRQSAKPTINGPGQRAPVCDLTGADRASRSLGLAKRLAKLAHCLGTVALQAAIERRLVLRAVVQSLDPEWRQTFSATSPR